MTKMRFNLLAAVLTLLVAAPLSAQLPTFAPVTDAVLANPDAADWLMINRTHDQQRFSPLNQINKKNVSQLRVA